MTKSEIVDKVRELAEKEVVLDLVDEFNEQVDLFDKLQAEEEHQWEVEKLERIEGGEKPENIEKPIFEYLDEFRALKQVFLEKKKAELGKKKEIEKQNLEKKRTYIAAMKDLIQNEENIGRAIARYRDIQEGWKEVGTIPRDKRQEIQQEYSNLCDSFQYNINIYKEIKDHDLSRNLDLKKEVIEKLQELLKVERIKEVEKLFHELQDEWSAIGGTRQEEWEKIKEEYWNTVNAIYDKIRTFYNDRKELRKQYIEEKKKLIAKVEELASNLPSTHKGWSKVTDKVLELQKDWKKIGFGPKEENDAVWDEFRAACNRFFDEKKKYFEAQSGEFEGIKQKKEELIKLANELKESTDWKNTMNRIKQLQKQWKDVGSAGPKFENRLWKKFREPIDHFFAAKDAHFEQKDAAFKGNLEKKIQLIEKLESYKADKDTKKTIEDLKGFSSEYAAIGMVPMKEKEKIQKRYKKALDAVYDGLKLDQGEKEKILFESRLEGIASSDNKEELIDKERSNIRRRLDKLNKELAQYENNLAFFANADESNPLFKNVMDNIRSTNHQIDDLKEQLKALNIAKNQTVETEVEAKDEEE